MKVARILVAQNPKGLQVTKTALSGYEVVTVDNIQRAKHQVMEDGIDLFLLGIHFDDSRAIELVSFIRNDEKHKKTPIIIMRVLPTLMVDSLRTTINALIKTGTVSQYLEVEGDQDPVDKIRKAVQKFLPKQNADYAAHESNGAK